MTTYRTWQRSLLLGLGALASALQAQGFDEDFTRGPTAPWVVFGEQSLFAWDAQAQALEVTWDSGRPNSYFARPLGTILNRQDDFTLGFALELDQVEVGVTAGKPYTFELAVGFLNWTAATSPAFRRGTGGASPNLVTLDYFPDSGYGATIWPTFVSREGRWNYNGSDDFTVVELEPGVRHRFELTYTAADQTLRTRLWRDGVAVGPIKDVRLAPRFTDYAVDTFAVCSYSDAGAQGSLRARGRVDDLTVRVPPPPLERITGRFVGQTWEVRFDARTNWLYVLERTLDGMPWEAVGTNWLEQANGPLALTDSTSLDHAFYRVRAHKP